MLVKLPLYQCHKQVRAAQIQAFLTNEDSGAELRLELPDGSSESVKVDADWLTRNPALAIGGYFILYVESPDQYTAYSPAEPFEDGYTIVDENAPEPVFCTGCRGGKREPVEEVAAEEPPKSRPYIAIAPGHVGGRVVEVGTVFNYEGRPGKWMQPHGWVEEATAVKAATPAPVVDRKAIMAQLDAAGVSYFKGASLEKLQALLPKG